MDVVQEWIRAQMDARNALVERVCEESLLDEQQRGVLVIQDHTGYVEAQLHSKVPWGYIYYVERGTDLDRVVSPPAEGG